MRATASATGIAGPKNGTPPPRVPLAEIDLDTMEFWEWDDDLRDGAFATLRRESPISFFEVPEFAGFPSGAGHWALTTFDATRAMVEFGGDDVELVLGERGQVGVLVQVLAQQPVDVLVGTAPRWV
jgi:hypothetical protein